MTRGPWASPFRNYPYTRLPSIIPYPVGSSGEADDDKPDNRKFCPREGRLLVFREDINSLFCPECAWTPPPPPPPTPSAPPKKKKSKTKKQEESK